MDCINGLSYYLNKCQTLSNTSQMTFYSFRKTALWCICIVHATQSHCCGALDFLSPEPCPQQPRAFDYKTRGVIQQREYESESERLKKSRSDELNSGDALIQHLTEKYAIFVFSRFTRQCRSTSYLGWQSKASFDCLLYW